MKEELEKEKQLVSKKKHSSLQDNNSDKTVRMRS